jgi:TRAP-type uncharacterized transport system fused permease subunit
VSPVLGAAAFLIAEFLRISYLEVIALAAIPTLLFYWSIFAMVELDAHKFGARPVTVENGRCLEPDPKVRLPFHFTRSHRCFYALGLYGDLVRGLRYPRVRRVEFPPA